MTSKSEYCTSSVLLFYMIYLLQTGIIAQQCSNNRQKTLVKLPQLFRYNYTNPCVEIDDFSPYLTQFLDTCVFASVTNAASFLKCQRECATDVTCVGMTVSTSTGCEHCLKTSAAGNGNSYLQDKVMIAIEEFWNFIDGKYSRFS